MISKFYGELFKGNQSLIDKYLNGKMILFKLSITVEWLVEAIDELRNPSLYTTLKPT